MPTRVRSYSKINLGLAVGPTRTDGFHPLMTLYQTLALHDIVTITAHPAPQTRLTVATNNSYVPCDARNTAWKMVALALERLGVTAEVHIDIQKRLPVQGGMGAGSANAAAALTGLEFELHQKLPPQERSALAAEVGSDVPLFLIGGAVLGEGRGELVRAMPDFPPTPCVIAIPAVGVSTPQAFRDLDTRMDAARRAAASASGLTETTSVDKLEKLSRAFAQVFPHIEKKTEGIEPGPSGISPTARPNIGSDTPSQEKGISGDLAENQGSQRACSLGQEATLLALVRTGIENDFEEVAFSQHPFLRDLKRQLMGSHTRNPAIYAALSGSGSALFGLYLNRHDAIAAQHRVQDTGTQALLTEDPAPLGILERHVSNVIARLSHYPGTEARRQYWVID